MMEFVIEWFQEPNALWVISGTTLLGISSGVLGSFAFLRRRGLMGDVLAHAALPGICLAFLFTGSKNPMMFMIGAIVSGVLATLAIHLITQFSRIKEDTALGLVLSIFFGTGIVFLTKIQHSQNGNQSGLDKFLFGQSASLIESDILVMGISAAVVILVSLLLFKEFKLLCFDAQFGATLGLPIRFLDLLLMFLLVVTVVNGLQAVGIVLMTALLITPAAAARYWTERFEFMVLIAAGIGGLSGILGTIVSGRVEHVSTGPVIVIVATFLFFLSFLFAPNRGLLHRWYRRYQFQNKSDHKRMEGGEILD